MVPRLAVICSYRLGMRDGVSVEAAKWSWALARLGFSVRTVAGEGPADLVLPGLALDARSPTPDRGTLATAFGGAEVVVVENLCSLPLNPAAGTAVAAALAGRPAVLHHHDLALERPSLAHLGPPPNDPAWLHVCASEAARRRLGDHGIEATLLRNAFDTRPPLGERGRTRARLGVGPRERLVLQPTRAIPRKGVPDGLHLAERLGATYWLTGAVEEGYDGELAALLGAARTRTIHAAAGDGPQAMADAYAACDLVVLPSSLEGFGNPAVEAAAHRRPVAVGGYPVADELRALGFSWLDLEDHAGIEGFLARPDRALLEANAALAGEHCNLDHLPSRLGGLLDSLGLDRLGRADAGSRQAASPAPAS